jgi:hypothetical protein
MCDGNSSEIDDEARNGYALFKLCRIADGGTIGESAVAARGKQPN